MDVVATNIVVQGQMVVTDLQAVGAMDFPAEGWVDLRADLEPHGFWWEDGRLFIPSDLVEWWQKTLRGEPVEWPRAVAEEER